MEEEKIKAIEKLKARQKLIAKIKKVFSIVGNIYFTLVLAAFVIIFILILNDVDLAQFNSIYTIGTVVTVVYLVADTAKSIILSKLSKKTESEIEKIERDRNESDSENSTSQETEAEERSTETLLIKAKINKQKQLVKLILVLAAALILFILYFVVRKLAQDHSELAEVMFKALSSIIILIFLFRAYVVISDFNKYNSSVKRYERILLEEQRQKEEDEKNKIKAEIFDGYNNQP